MSELNNRIQEDIKSAMIAKDQLKLDTLRLLKTAILNLKTSGKNSEITDDSIIQIIRKSLKQREDAASEYNSAGRIEARDKELAEAEVLKSYLPAELSDEDLRQIIDEYLSSNGLSDKKSFGAAMKGIQPIISGRADNKRISAYLNEVLK